ncbi:MAG: hypothetical protein IJJ26_06635 [Victivallales bacterium]|nr:hypothetical protein [Victivallales bacterium]
MQSRTWNIAIRKFASLGRDDSGAVLVITLAMFFFLFMLVSGVYAIGESVRSRIELQNACDAAAYSAAVVQADGLSRIATVNRAMAWTYVQMVKRQMDYITYRWLKLTYKQFKEDRDNAEDWFFHLLPCDKHHDRKGTGWWCGQGSGNGMDIIRLNYRMNIKKDDLKKTLDKMDSAMGDGKGASNSKDDSSGGGSSSGSGNSGNSGNVSNSMFGEADQMFGINPLNPVKTEVYDKITKMTAAGQNVGAAEVEQIYKDIFTRSFPEPPMYIPDPMRKKQMILNPKWTMWNEQFRLFVSGNKINVNDYICKICGRAIRGNDHSACMQHMMDQANEKAQAGASQEPPESPDQPTKAPVSKYKWGNKLAEQIKNDKKSIEMMNLALDAISMNMALGMREAARNVLEFNLPRNRDDEVSDDFYYTIHIPTGSNPYGASQSGDASLAGIFSPVYNTEEFETLFLNMMDGEVHDSLLEYFTGTKSSGILGTLFGGGNKAGGLDQWFIRTYPNETYKNNEKHIEPTSQSYYAEGISRSYKNANRKEGRGALGHNRANHVMSIGDNLGVGGGSDMFGLMNIFSSILDSLKQQVDLAPSCINRRTRFPEMCDKIDDSVALVSQYRWCSAKWFCFFTIYLFGIEWHHPFFPKFWCGDHGYGFIWIGDELDALFNGGKARKDYRNCFMGFDDTFIFKGHARIYGDDRDLVDENYTGTPARPWLLNEKFFGGDGTITVGLARRQRNPWQRIISWLHAYDYNSPNLSSGIFSLFNVNADNYQWTVSTARAAYRRRTDGVGSTSSDSGGHLPLVWETAGEGPLGLHLGGGQEGGTSAASWHDSHATGYDMKFDASAWPNALKINYASGASGDLKKLRVGCVCGRGDNHSRLEHAWNLGTTDWDATLLPVRYAKGHLAKYESWKESGASWSASNGEGSSVFGLLGGLKWSGFGENTGSVSGASIMQTTNQEDRPLGSLEELEKLKIY